MISLRFDRLVSLVCFVCLFCVVPRSSEAQDAPLSTLQTYRDLRSALLADGWKPDVHYGLKTNNGRPLYRFPEVLCGPQICNARWLSRAGQEKLVTLIRGDGREEYRVAPR
ncbi:MAG: hypothetical protein C3F11_03095 [Methylocystaceae bacterium]|nr:MAG: hypothetical protein C3F11_03095 [Methylocystaceae bacterium]